MLNTPCNEYGVNICMQNLGETDICNTTQFVSHMGGDIRELDILQDRFINADELNYRIKCRQRIKYYS